MAENVKAGMYGNPMPTGPMRIFGLPVPGLVIAALGFLVSFGLCLAGLWLGVLWVVLATCMVLVLFFISFGEPDAGRSIASRVRDTLSQHRRDALGESTYVSGFMSNLPKESLFALPGPLADMVEVEGIDGLNQPYTLLHHRPVGSLAAVFECSPNGTALVPQEMVNAQIGQYARWLGSFSEDHACEGAVVVIDSSLSSSEPLREKILSEASPLAPEKAVRVLEEATGSLPALVTGVKTYAAVVWKIKELDDDVEGAAAEVASKLPAHRDALYAAGSGLPAVATGLKLGQAVQVAYDPGRAAEFERDALTGMGGSRTVSMSGPEYFVDRAFQGAKKSNQRLVFHGGVCSMTVMMLVPDRGHITDKTYARLFAPSDKFLRKRVAIFYRPVPREKQRNVAKKNKQGAGFTASTQRGNVSAFQAQKVANSTQAEKEISAGASLDMWMLMVTVTFEANKKAHRQAENKLKEILSGMTYMFIQHGRSAAFHSTLPLGVLPWLYQGSSALWANGAGDESEGEQ